MNSADGIDLDMLTTERFDQLAVRVRVVSALAASPGRSRWDVEHAAVLAGVHPSTIYRHLARIRGGGKPTVRLLSGQKGGFPKGRSRLDPRVEAVIVEALSSYHLTSNQPSLAATTKVIGNACETLGLTAPSKPTVNRRLKKFRAARVAGARQGRAAREKLTPRTGRFEIEAAWDVWQIDHTLADVILVDKAGRKPVGRPWLTVVIDVATRMVVGFYVSLEPPSVLRAAVAIDLAVRNKVAWLREKGLDYEWPAEGLPRMVHSDRAREFQAKSFERALLNEGVETFLRPAGAPHWGGHVERLIGTMMGACKMLPGATQNSPTARGDYDSCKGARLDIEQLETWFAHQILGVYHNTRHSALGCTPMEAWRDRTRGRMPRRPSNDARFRIDLLPEFTGTITRTGMKAFGEQYASEELMLAFIAGVRKVRVKFDPRDLSKLHVPIGEGVYIETPYRIRDLPGRSPTLWFYRYARRVALQQGVATEGVLAREARARIEQSLHGEALGSRLARRALERMRHARAAMDETPGNDVQDDDSWGGVL